jgi:hypothetical protein
MQQKVPCVAWTSKVRVPQAPDAILVPGSAQVLVGSRTLIYQYRRELGSVFLSHFRVVVAGADALRGGLTP